MANAFRTSGWPMLLILAEANAFIPAEYIMRAASGRPSPNGAGGLRPLAPFGEFIICSASIKSIGHPLVLKALGNYLFQKPSEFKAALYPPAIPHPGPLCTPPAHHHRPFASVVILQALFVLRWNGVPVSFGTYFVVFAVSVVKILNILPKFRLR